MSLNATLLSRRQPDSKDNILLHYAHLSLHKPGALWLLPLDTRKYQPGKPLWPLPLGTRKYQPGKPLETLMFRLGALVSRRCYSKVTVTTTGEVFLANSAFISRENAIFLPFFKLATIKVRPI